MFRARDPLLILAQLLAAGLGTIAALAATGWPSGLTGALVGLAGAFLGLLAALGIEHVVRLHREVRRLQGIERQNEAGREQREEERRLWSYQLAVARRGFAVSEASMKVYGDALREVDPQGQRIPLAALMARIEVTQKARNIDKPLPPLDEWRGPPRGQPL